MEEVMDENSEEFKNLQKTLDGIKYHGNLVTLSDDNFFMVMPADNFHKAMQEAAKDYIKNLNK